jgi:hypothetical protein
MLMTSAGPGKLNLNWRARKSIRAYDLLFAIHPQTVNWQFLGV